MADENTNTVIAQQVVVPASGTVTLQSGTYTVTVKETGYEKYGAIYLGSGGTLTGTGTQGAHILFTGNTFFNTPAILYSYFENAAGGTASFEYTDFTNNYGQTNGAMFYLRQSSLSITHGTIDRNTGTGCSVIFAAGGSVTLNDVTISNNVGDRSAVRILSEGTLTLGNVTFSGNTGDGLDGTAQTMAGAVWCQANLNFTGDVTLTTATDRIAVDAVSSGGNVNWVVSSDAHGYLNDYSKIVFLENAEKSPTTRRLTLTSDDAVPLLSEKPYSATMILAGNAATADGSVFRTYNSANAYVDATVNGMGARFGEDTKGYGLFTDADNNLVLAAFERITVDADETYELDNPGFAYREGAYSGYGGVAYVDGGTLSYGGTSTIEFAGNAATLGGVIYNNAGTVDLKNVTFTGNSSKSGGNSIYTTGNTATGTGGTVSLQNANFFNNRGGGNGGIIHAAGSTLSITDGTVANNNCDGDVFLFLTDASSRATLTNMTFAGNTGTRSAVRAHASSTITLADVTFDGNVASTAGWNYGAAWASQGGNIALAGKVYLNKNTDNILIEQDSRIRWVVSGGTCGYLNDYAKLSCYGTRYLNASGATAMTTYILADNAAAANGVTFATGQTTAYVNGATGGANGQSYKLVTNADKQLVLAVFETKTVASGECWTIWNPGMNYTLVSGAQAIRVEGGTLAYHDQETLTFADNTSSTMGTVIYASSGSVIDLENVNFINNEGNGNGNTMHVKGSTVTLVGGTAAGNNGSKHSGGGDAFLFSDSSNTTLRNFVVANNYSSRSAVRATSGSLTLDNVTFSGNTGTASYNGADDARFGAVWCATTLNLAGDVFLIGNYDYILASTLNWQVTDDTHGYVSDYAKVVNSSKKITVSGDLTTQKGYKLADNAATAANTAFTTVVGGTSVTLYGGGIAKAVGDTSYSLQLRGKNGDELVLGAFKRIVVNSGTVTTLTDPGADFKTVYYTGQGGVAAVEGGTLTYGGTATLTFSGNSSSGNGSVIYNNGGVVDLKNVKFISNDATAVGGAIYLKGGTLALDNAYFSGNECNHNYSGGDIGLGAGSVVTITNSTFAGNTSQGNGASIHCVNSGARTYITIKDTTFSNYTKTSRGAIRCHNQVTLTMGNVTFSGNTATATSGGGTGVCNIEQGAILNIVGRITLDTDSDTLCVMSSTVNWDLTAGSAGNTDFAISDWSRVTLSSQTLTVTVNSTVNEQYCGTYTLAENSVNGFGITLKGAAGGSKSMAVNATTQTTNSYTIASTGTVYTMKYNAAQENGDEVIPSSVTLDVSRTIFVNGSWTTGESVSVTTESGTFSGTVGEGTFFNDYNTASAVSGATNSKLVVLGGTFSTSVKCDGSSTTVQNSAIQKMFFGGQVCKADTDATGNYTITIAGGTAASTFGNSIAGGDVASSGSNVSQSGNINLVIEGGTFTKRVAGGMYVADQDAKNYAVLNGNVNLTITGGTFTGRIYGGNNAQTDALGAQTTLIGNVNVLVDCKNAIHIGENLVAGSRGAGVIVGNTTVTFSGTGSNLTFGGGTTGSSVVFGGCNADVMKKQVIDDETYYTPVSNVTGSRNLVFNAFTGDFGAEIRLFSTISFENVSTVNFKNTKLDLWGVSVWNFEYGSSLTGLTANEFAQDTLNFDLTKWSSADDWTVATGSVEAMADLGSAAAVNFGSLAAKYDGENACWTASDTNYTYTLALNDDQNAMSVSKIAITTI